MKQKAVKKEKEKKEKQTGLRDKIVAILKGYKVRKVLKYDLEVIGYIEEIRVL